MSGRKDKNTVDYFPHYCEHGKTIFILENKFGNNGYAVWFKILELLGKSENHYIDCRNSETWEFMQAKMKLMSTELEQILNTLSNLNAIHVELWENKIIWSGNFIKNIVDVYKRRNNSCMQFNDLCNHLLIKCKHEYDNEGNIVDINPQSKVKYSKVKESIEYSVFYDTEIENNKNHDLIEKYKSFLNFIFGKIGTDGEMEYVLKLSKQLTFKQFLVLRTRSRKENIPLDSIVKKMNNWAPLLKRHKTFKGSADTFIDTEIKGKK
jgi:hypothetical protein